MSSSIDGYTLSWENHTSDFFLNLKDLLQRDELVDVTLVADGHMFNAHRLVLSALSSHFRQMFAQVPANQHTFVFLNNVSKKTLEDLITFIYSGQVDVKHEHLEEVLNTAKALNIKGLSDKSYTPFDDSTEPPTFNSSIVPATECVQYQSTHTIRVPESTKPDQDQLNYHQQPTNASDQHLTENMNEMNGHGDNYNNTCYDYANYCFSDMGHDDPMVMDQEWGFDLIHATEVQPAKPNVLKLSERVVCGIDTTEYDLDADIRSNDSGSENLFYENYKFNKHNKPNKYGQQRWQCTSRVGSQRCRAAASTMEVNGNVMMKVVSNEHSH